jgi:hypothetical protein
LAARGLDFSNGGARLARIIRRYLVASCVLVVRVTATPCRVSLGLPREKGTRCIPSSNVARSIPKRRAASGFTGFDLVNDQEHGINTAIIVWETKAHADAFDAGNSAWMQTLDSLGHTLQSDNRGETVMQIEPRK